MSNRVMIDSSLLIEFAKGAKKQLLLSLIHDLDNECYINETIVSEYLYYFLILNSNSSPQSLTSSKKINGIFSQSPDYMMLENFMFLSSDNSLFSLAPDYMAKYNLLPNDAIILATCKIHNITQLASHVKDFEEACKGEGITLLKEE